MPFSEVCIYQVKPDKVEEFGSKEDYGRAQKDLYGSFWKPIDKCLIQPHDKYLGEVII